MGGEALSNLAASRISASAAADDDDLELYGNVPAPGNVGQLGRGSPTSDRDSYGSVPNPGNIARRSPQNVPPAPQQAPPPVFNAGQLPPPPPNPFMQTAM